MYPLNMTNKAGSGYAVANDEAEHQALSVAGYEPKWTAAVETKVYADGTQATGVAPLPNDSPKAEAEADPAETDGAGHTVESVRAQLDAAGIAYDKRLGLAKLIALLPA